MTSINTAAGSVRIRIDANTGAPGIEIDSLPESLKAQAKAADAKVQRTTRDLIDTKSDVKSFGVEMEWTYRDRVFNRGNANNGMLEDDEIAAIIGDGIPGAWQFWRRAERKSETALTEIQKAADDAVAARLQAKNILSADIDPNARSAKTAVVRQLRAAASALDANRDAGLYTAMQAAIKVASEATSPQKLQDVLALARTSVDVSLSDTYRTQPDELVSDKQTVERDFIERYPFK